MLSTLENDRIRIADLEAQLLALERVAERLRAQKDMLQQRLDSYRYPVLTLPHEIVSEIFTHFLPTYYPACLWRSLSLATPALWRAISLSCFDDIPFRRAHHLSQQWLRKSGSCPLSIKLDAFHEEDEAAELLAAGVVSYHARWEYVELRIRSSSYLVALEGGSASMPLLRDLKLMLDPHSDSPAVRFCEMPLLRTAILTYCAASSVILPWAQLTSLTLNWITPLQCVPILQQTCNLVHCDLALYCHFSGPVPDIQLPCVQSLVIGDPPLGLGIPGYLETLTVPALRKLEISEQFLARSNDINSLASFISKSGCNISELHLLGDHLEPEDSYRRAFPSIQFSFN
ncbi:hypothetical protein DFH06DRAFT_1327162 [Mycena polygramma]|nr:hypothetical protein DFH06DRAFT_1327162 [Mycena polygramma]